MSTKGVIHYFELIKTLAFSKHFFISPSGLLILAQPLSSDCVELQFYGLCYEQRIIFISRNVHWCVTLSFRRSLISPRFSALGTYLIPYTTSWQIHSLGLLTDRQLKIIASFYHNIQIICLEAFSSTKTEKLPDKFFGGCI